MPVSGVLTGSGSPEGAVAAPVGALYTQIDGLYGQTLWRKYGGNGVTGWSLIDDCVFRPEDYGAKGDGSADDTAPVRSALAAVEQAGGGVLRLCGKYRISRTLVLERPNVAITLLGSGASEAGGLAAPSVLHWTGGRAPMLDVRTDVRNLTIASLDFENTGTATHFLKADFTDMIRLSNINMRPAVSPSTAFVELGPVSGKRCENVFFDHVTIRGRGGAEIGLLATRVQDFRAIRLNVVNAKTVIGTSESIDIVNWACFGCSFNNTPNANVVEIRAGRSVVFSGCHFENAGSGYGIEIALSARDQKSIALYGCYFSATPHTPYAVNLDDAEADLSCYDCYMVQYQNPSFLLRNRARRSVRLFGCNVDTKGGTLADSLAGVCVVGGLEAGIPAPDRLSVHAQGLSIGDPTARGVAPIRQHLSHAEPWRPPRIPAGAQATQTITLYGAALGDVVSVALDQDLEEMQLTGYVSAPDRVTVVLRNGTERPVALPAAVLRADVWKH